jgi:hypothetical protein
MRVSKFRIKISSLFKAKVTYGQRFSSLSSERRIRLHRNQIHMVIVDIAIWAQSPLDLIHPFYL